VRGRERCRYGARRLERCAVARAERTLDAPGATPWRNGVDPSPVSRPCAVVYTLSMDVESVCPYCGEPLTFWVDEGGGSRQRYIEDCAVCCRPIEIQVGPTDDGELELQVHRDDD